MIGFIMFFFTFLKNNETWLSSQRISNNCSQTVFNFFLIFCQTPRLDYYSKENQD